MASSSPAVDDIRPTFQILYLQEKLNFLKEEINELEKVKNGTWPLIGIDQRKITPEYIKMLREKMIKISKKLTQLKSLISDFDGMAIYYCGTKTIKELNNIGAFDLSDHASLEETYKKIMTFFQKK